MSMQILEEISIIKVYTIPEELEHKVLECLEASNQEIRLNEFLAEEGSLDSYFMHETEEATYCNGKIATFEVKKDDKIIYDSAED